MATTQRRREHKRVYQACEPCREKKVRCELGVVDQPCKPPCARCRRESRECVFAATRIRDPGEPKERHRPSSNTRHLKRQASSPIAEDRSSAHTGVYSSPALSIPRTVINHTTPPATDRNLLPPNGRATAVLLKGHPPCDSAERRRAVVDDFSAHLNPAVAHLQNSSSDTGNAPAEHALNPLSPGTREALRAWSGLRFVRGGLFTPEEALNMVDHFYKFHAPFSPVVPECFRAHAQHPALIEEEPILTITILMIGSRYRKWTGLAAASRSFLIHDRLWRYLQGMITRLFWCEDIFVGEFASLTDPLDNAFFSSRSNTWSNGFRTIGTCEALLLLLDWHPQGLHFPPPDEDTTTTIVREPKRRRFAAEHKRHRGPGSGHDWLARSDRLCRSMLSTASMLATEMGVFDEEELISEGENNPLTMRDMASHQQRICRVRYLIWVYATQQPGRPGWRILTPEPSLLLPSTDDDTIKCWVRVATIMKYANELLFSSQKRTNEIIRNGEYIKCLQTLQPLLQDTIIEFDQSKLTKQMRSILTIEYAHVQLCILSVALQAVIERRYYCDEMAREPQPIPPHVLKQEEGYLNETVKGAQTILLTVLDDFVPDGSLRYLPVRSYSRLLGAALFLLKCCAARIKEVDTRASLSLIKQLVAGLRSIYVDDTHLSPRWGDLLDQLSRRVEAHATAAKNCAQPANLVPSDPAIAGNAASGLHTPMSTALGPSSSQPLLLTPNKADGSRSVRTHMEFHHSNCNNSNSNNNNNGLQEFDPWAFGGEVEGSNFEAFSMWWDSHIPQSIGTNHTSLHHRDSEQPFYHATDGGLMGSAPGFPTYMY
ncbi:hypothetical protein UA08_02834 [Talaromyces atroroseus]|uniref:Zn(2)-C6 fungal-type domain-containing protein n=1 Tax=Talaromyces atroroseus TaxID=1441469 RepID=A0A225AX32_TALAT|nr:hypothetical protein UA08_02834 [Talaromyces atroroseus]OKL61888.1 hypothetical protein UA08_02834 [Talaromyces atroroseus]